MNRHGSMEVLRQVASGDAQALGVLFDQWHPYVYGVVCGVMQDSDEVEAIVEGTFWQLWRETEKNKVSEGGMFNWVVSKARDHAVARVRAGAIPAEIVQPGFRDDRADAEEHGTPDSARRTSVLAALVDLPPGQREVLNIVYNCGRSLDDVAERLSVSPKTVKTNLRLALFAVQSRLQISPSADAS